MEIDYISGPQTDKIFGTSKYQNEILKRLPDVHFNFIEYTSLTYILEKKYNSLASSETSNSINSVSNKTSQHNILNKLINIGKHISNDIDRYRYSYLVKKELTSQNVKHIPHQELAYLLNSFKSDKTIVTCFDLIPWAYTKNRSSFWKKNMNGLKKANRIITISNFSKNEIIKYLEYPEENIAVVYPAVDHDSYRKLNKKEKLIDNPKDKKIILYVGSEEPRQNVNFLIKSFKMLKKRIPGIILLKIGTPNLLGARKKNLNLIKALHLENDVIFKDIVTENELPLFYNAADLVVYPCSYAGFGMPPLEAMACGTPVITSNMSSLPEVVGNAGIMVDPKNISDLTDNMYNVLIDKDLNEKMTVKGLKRAKMFNWDESAEKTFEVYNEVNGDQY